jgi:hypothetical protein
MRLGHVLTAASLCLPLLLTGCALQQTAAPVSQPGVRLTGNVHGGQQPIVGAHVYLFAANSTGYGQPSVSLLSAASTGLSDSVGAYVTSDANGGFTITGNYSCTPNTQVYLYALGGNPGAGVNSGAALLAVLGNCPSSGSFLGAIPFIQVNEVTTVAAAYAMAGFATDATHVSSSGTPQALIGIANAFVNAANLADISSGSALTTTPAGNGAVPNKTINTLANALAACINSTGPGSTPCSTLFSSALSGGTSGTPPPDTATAIINIAHNPGANVAAILSLPTATPPFAPTVIGTLNDFTLAISFTGPTINASANIAIDASGNVWTFNNPSGSFIVTEMSPTGAILSGANGYAVGNDVVFPSGSLAIDQNGNAWLTGSSHIYKISSTGTVSTFQPDEGSVYWRIAIDASGNAWTGPASGSPILVELTPNGTDLHYTPTSPVGYNPTFDSSGIVWTVNSGALYGTTIATGTNVNVTETDLSSPGAVAIDATGSPWALGGSYLGAYYLTQFGYNSSTQTYAPVSNLICDCRPSGIAIDGAGVVWATPNYSAPSIAAYSYTGAGITTIGNYGMNVNGFSSGIALDPSGDVWTANTNHIVEYIGASTPVVTPISVGVKNHTLATRP